MNIWQWTPQALMSCKPILPAAEAEVQRHSRNMPWRAIRLLITRKSFIPGIASVELARGWFLTPCHHRDECTPTASFPRAWRMALETHRNHNLHVFSGNIQVTPHFHLYLVRIQFQERACQQNQINTLTGKVKSTQAHVYSVLMQVQS